MLHIGIDVGSTTVKAVVIQSDTKEVLFSRYERHNACQSEKVRVFLQDIFSKYPQEQFRLAFCGSGGRTIAEVLHASYIQEVVANSIAVRTFYPQAKVAIELGGQDAKIVFFYHDKATNRLAAGDMRMNGSCAGGTGAFIDEMASLLRTPVEKFDALAAKGTQVYDISGRCGVFAKTDIQPLLNQGGLLEDIALSTFHAIAKQTIGGLAQGLEIHPPVVFEGGPLTFNPTLIRVFAERLGLKEPEIIVPPNAELFIAFGAALSINEMFQNEEMRFSPEAALTTLSMYREIVAGNSFTQNLNFFNSEGERDDFAARHKMQTINKNASGLQRGETLRVYMGLDAGSTTTKFVLIDENENVVDCFYSPNKGEPLKVIKQALMDMYKKYQDAGINLEVLALGTTGYGELLFDKALGADFHTVETVAHAAAAQKYIPGVSFILDIGGQDMKAINISNGIVTNITVNEACSSGCGSFLETFAETLHIPVDKIAEIAFNAKNPARLGSRCTVFMNSTIITEQKNGKQADDIMAGLCRSIVENVFTKVVRISNTAQLGDKIVVQGGTLKNDAVLRALEQYLGKSIVRSPFPGEMGAIGIALLTKRHIAEHGYTSPHGTGERSRFIGFEAIKDFDYTQEANVICPFCSNNCNRTLVRFSKSPQGTEGLTWVTGNRCERGELVGDPNDPALREEVNKRTQIMNSVPDMVKIRDELVFKDYPFTQLLPSKDITIGIPRVLDFWRNMPFWKVFWGALGFKTKISARSSRKLYEKGIQYVASDTVCFPAKLVHGHIEDLIEKKVDRIFFPQINRLPPDNPERFSTFTCPVLKGYPLSIRFSNNPEEKHNIPFDTPICHWFSKRDQDFQLCRYMRQTFNIPEKTVLSAIKQGENALEDFNRAMTDNGKKIIDDVTRKGDFAVVIAGRHYQYDEHINHNLSRYFTSIGIPVLTLDSLPNLKEVPLGKSRVEITNNNHARLLSGAIVAAEHPALEYVDIFNFGCGHDAVYTDEITRIMDEISGKSPLILKMDESEIAGPLRIRVRSFIETVMIRRKKVTHNAKPLGDPYPVKLNKTDKQKVILIPNVSRAFCLIVSSALVNDGYRAEPLPMAGAEAIAMGKKYVHNDMCLPAQIVIGEAILTLKSGKYDPNNTVIGTGKVLCDCRLSNYMPLARKALDEAGFPQVPVITTDMFDLKNAHPGMNFTPITYSNVVWSIIQADALEFLRRRIRPYELQKGQTDKVVDKAFKEISEGLAKRGLFGTIKPFKRAIKELCKVRYDRSKLKEQVFMQGEYLLTFHPASNLEVEKYLEKNGMEVIFPRMYGIYRHLFLNHTLCEMKQFKVKHSLYDNLFAKVGSKFMDFAVKHTDRIAKMHPLYESDVTLEEVAKLSDHIMHHSILSGESFLIAADILHYAAKGIRSFAILQPFGCLPNHICGRGIIKRIKEQHPDIQILPLDYDPDVSFANIENRLQMLIMNARSLKKVS
ncbi:MAG: acyl-CoA dehydratase activase [Treponema sp.]|jgi:predicted CoA-substrate-specific enzyme activase|nr:acyl-CoA dehydratase activase [Treponema sp.]